MTAPFAPSLQDLLRSEFCIKDHNTHGAPANWEKDHVILLHSPEEIPQNGQFGFSVKTHIDGVPYFIKLPPPPGEPHASIEEAVLIAHYTEMRKRFETEFSKCDSFDHIIKRGEAWFNNQEVTFSIAKPLALCEVTGRDLFVPVPALIYQFAGKSDLASKTAAFKAESADKFLSFAKALSRIVQLIHNQGILHSFIVPRNVVVKEKNKYFLVGFGYSTFCDSKAVSPLFKVSEMDNRYRAPECDSRSEILGALWFPADIYSIGALLYRYATGTDPATPDTVPRDVDRLKNDVYDKLKKLNDDWIADNKNGSPIFQSNENILKILDKCLRYEPEDRYSCAEELIDALEIASTATGSPPTRPPVAPSRARKTKDLSGVLYRELAAITEEEMKKVDKKPIGIDRLFDSLLQSWCKNAVEDAGRMGRGHYEVYGHRDVLVTSLCRLIAGAQEDDLYRTMTMPSYWTNDNLGKNGRFLTMNKHMARKGLNIERLFLVTQDFHELSEDEQEILEFQLQAQRDVNEYLRGKNAPGQANSGKFEIKVHKLESLERLISFETDARHVAYLQTRGGKKLCLNFVSQGLFQWLNGRKSIERTIRKVRYWLPIGFRQKSFDSNVADFENLWGSGALNLEDYVKDKGKPSLMDLLGKVARA